MVVDTAGDTGKAPTTRKKKEVKARAATSSSVTKVDFLQNISNSELTMIHRLAGNDPAVRKATIRKLKKWLKAIATKVPDTLESRKIIDANFGRVWKALFYCMWMADKPLPQETLAEQISNFVSIFADKPNLMILFVEWFFVTFVREWPWIDRLRMDKFMMLIRRFLRKMLQEFARSDWADENLDRFTEVLTVHLFNHHPQLTKSKKRKSKAPEPLKAPLGFQIHIVDIFLEELAKVGGDTLESEKILKLLSPFVNEMVENDDQRLLDEIQDRIFYHLMKQSDTGIDYIESRGGTLELVEPEDGDEDDEEDEDDAQKIQVGPLDPRAGQVDVILPQLKVDYESLVEMLSEAAGRETAKARNRKTLLKLARKFDDLTKGHYPLGFSREGSRVPAIKRSEIEAAAQRLVEMEESLVGPKTKRKNKKQRQHPSQAFLTPNDSVHSEDNSEFLNDSNLMDHVDDNYDGYLEDIQNNQTSSKKSNGSSPKAETNSPRATKTAKRRKSKLATAPSTPISANKVDSPATVNESVSNGQVNVNSDGDTYVVIKQKKRRMSETHNVTPRANKQPKAKLSSDQLSKIYSPLLASSKRMKLETPKEVMRTPSPRSMEKPSSLRKTLTGPSAPATPQTPSSTKKKVNFVLTKNLEHPHSDYQESIQRSPAIPYDGKKRPSFGLLKSRSPATTPLSPRKRLLMRASQSQSSPPAKNGNASTPRRKASDFF